MTTSEWDPILDSNVIIVFETSEWELKKVYRLVGANYFKTFKAFKKFCKEAWKDDGHVTINTDSNLVTMEKQNGSIILIQGQS